MTERADLPHDLPGDAVRQAARALGLPTAGLVEFTASTTEVRAVYADRSAALPAGYLTHELVVPIRKAAPRALRAA